MESLAWTLLVIGLSAVVAVLFWRRRGGFQEMHIEEREGDDWVDYDDNGELLSEVRVITPRQLMAEEQVAKHEAKGSTPPAANGEKVDLTPPEPEPIDKVVVLHVLAPHGSSFQGLDIRAALISEGLVLGSDGFFCRRDERNSCTKWRVANMLRPGTFDVANFEACQTPGLTLFMAMPGPFSFLDAFDDLIDTGKRLTERLSGTLADERRNRINDQIIAFEREAVIDYATHQKREQTELAL